MNMTLCLLPYARLYSFSCLIKKKQKQKCICELLSFLSLGNLTIGNGSQATVQHICEFQATLENGAYMFPQNMPSKNNIVFYECWFPGFNNVLWFDKTLTLGKTE